MRYHNFTIGEHQFRGYAKAIIPALEARGYEAERDELNPHPYWQQAEHLKKEIENEQDTPQSRATHARANNHNRRPRRYDSGGRKNSEVQN